MDAAQITDQKTKAEAYLQNQSRLLLSFYFSDALLWGDLLQSQYRLQFSGELRKRGLRRLSRQVQGCDRHGRAAAGPPALADPGASGCFHVF